MSANITQQDRRRRFAERIQRHAQSWQTIWMTSEYDTPSIAKGRWIASQEFSDWLSGGGTLGAAPAWLNEREAHWTRELEQMELMDASALRTRLEKEGYPIKRENDHMFIPGFTVDEKEKIVLDFYMSQYRSIIVGIEHLRRFLRDA